MVDFESPGVDFEIKSSYYLFEHDCQWVVITCVLGFNFQLLFAVRVKSFKYVGGDNSSIVNRRELKK